MATRPAKSAKPKLSARERAVLADLERLADASDRTESARKTLGWVLGQGQSEKSVRTALGLTQRQIAARLGVSDRAVRHYLKPPGHPDHRAIPDRLLQRLDTVLDDASARLQLRRQVQDDAQGLRGMRPPDLPPLRQFRYERPLRLTAGVVEPSQIVGVDVRGLDYADIRQILQSYWYQLRGDGRKWDVRFQVRIRVVDYFRGGVVDAKYRDGQSRRSIRKSMRRRHLASILIPRSATQRHFLTPILRAGDAEPVIDNLMHVLTGPEYGDRIQYVETITFTPFAPDGRKTRKRKRYYGK